MMMPTPAPRKGLAVSALVLGVLSVFTFGCLGVGAVVAIVLGIVALVKAGRAPQEYGGKGMAIGGIVGGALGLISLPFVGIIAAIAIPSLLRARVSANESSNLGDVRSVISAEVAYAGSNNGDYGTLECLAAPGPCLPGYTGPVFLDPAFTSEIRNGYRRSLMVRPRRGPRDESAFAYVAVPVEPGRTGVRAFCGDSTGRICVTADGREPNVDAAQCAEPCTPLL